MDSKILAIDDNLKICELLKDYSLGFTTYHLDFAHDRKTVLKLLEENTYKLITLDIELENENGLDLIEEIKEKYDIPIIFVSVLHDSEVVITALEKGADDYVKKPFHVKELFLRIDKVIKRCAASDKTLIISDYRIDESTNTVYRDGKQIDLSTVPSKLLIILLKNAGRALSRDEIYEGLWDADYVYSSRVIDSHITMIRKKTMDSRIKSIRGFGYKFEDLDE